MNNHPDNSSTTTANAHGGGDRRLLVFRDLPYWLLGGDCPDSSI